MNKNPSPCVAPKIIECILEIRDHPPDHLKRTPGPKTILYFLKQDPVWGKFNNLLPRSTKTIWEILKAHDRIPTTPVHQAKPLDRAAPMTEWELDFKDVSSVPADPEGKQMHVVETLNIVDTGTSILVDAKVREDFNAETALRAVAEVLVAQGLPKKVTFDRDPRWVGSSTGRDFPSPFVRFWYCLGVEPEVCPPQHPEKNPFVERYNGTYGRECLDPSQPRDVGQAQAVTQAFKHHYNVERPHQGLSCGNQPPYTAFPELPVLPTLPDQVDPDAWLQAIHDEGYVRKVQHDGRVVVNRQYYYIQQRLRGQYVVLRVDAPEHQFVVYHNSLVLKTIPIKGLRGSPMPFSDYLTYICEEARVDWQKTQAQRVLNRRRSLYA